jgi:hypothetical protein
VRCQIQHSPFGWLNKSNALCTTIISPDSNPIHIMFQQHNSEDFVISVVVFLLLYIFHEQLMKQQRPKRSVTVACCSKDCIAKITTFTPQKYSCCCYCQYLLPLVYLKIHFIIHKPAIHTHHVHFTMLLT